MSGGAAALGVAALVNQHYLLEARQMQALSFAVHIPLVCFGIAFPVMMPNCPRLTSTRHSGMPIPYWP